MRLVSALYDNHHPWEHFFPGAACVVADKLTDLQPGDILILHGGQDISPSLYKQGVSSYTSAEAVPSPRDAIEWELLHQAVKLQIPILGICRGAQMLCAAAGGTLIQHVDNHLGQHTVHTESHEFSVNSIHHQMMNVTNTEHVLLAWTKRANMYIGVDERGGDVTINVDKEPELVFFPTLKGLAIQWHPEMMQSKAPATQYLKDFITHEFATNL